MIVIDSVNAKYESYWINAFVNYKLILLDAKLLKYYTGH